eukprot:TRINITY_DN1076_c0_g2_i2.p1 TRINITY_DN1076_c0_g2~~TRINITY_DN1076_c0_g2_i2.p1  ORF type:complete len:499 (+),score=193.58 TRINITY_DN1076_c0_g2_i2:758-2254(+)
MPRELVCLQVGQCGNQIGCKFWDLALQEHLKYTADGARRKQGEGRQRTVKLDEAMSSFFYAEKNAPSADGDEVRMQNVKARAIPVDMEEGVLDGLLHGSLATLFDRKQCIANTDGCGNNWAVGYEMYGTTVLEDVMESVRRTVEDCDSLQTFLLLHSLGGGTGSGFGTRILRQLEDEYPSIYRFVSAVFPQENDDVVTSPYNSILSLSKLVEHADCVIPVDNQQLSDIAALCEDRSGAAPARRPAHPSSAAEDERMYSIAKPSAVKGKKVGEKKGGEAFDTMNYIVASMLTHLTASMRFPGSLNVDLNEITTNLVPFPRLHFLHSSVAPIYTTRSDASGSRRIAELFRDSFDRRCQLLTCPSFRPTYFASCALFRGDVTLSDVTSNIDLLKKKIKLAEWNTEGFKVGMCGVPATETPVSLLSLTNNTGIVQSFANMETSFLKLYHVRAHLHHYTEYLEHEEMDAAHGAVRDLIQSYEDAAQIKLPFNAGDLRGNKLLF